MFDLFSWSHILILLVVALVVVGPKELPRMMHMAGKWAGKARAMANEFRKSFDDMARQAELDELRKEIDALRTHRPLADIQSALDKSFIPPDMQSSPMAPAQASVTTPLASAPSDPVVPE